MAEPRKTSPRGADDRPRIHIRCVDGWWRWNKGPGGPLSPPYATVGRAVDAAISALVGEVIGGAVVILETPQ